MGKVDFSINSVRKTVLLQKKIKSWTGPLSYTIYNNHLKVEDKKHLNVRPEAVKLLEENIGDKLLDIGLGNDFLDRHQKQKQQKKN